MNSRQALELLENSIRVGRIETLKTSLNERRFVGFYKNPNGGETRIEAAYEIYPQYIQITKVTICKGFDIEDFYFQNFVIAKDSFVGEYMLH